MSIELLTMRKFYFVCVPAKNRTKLNIVEYGDFSERISNTFSVFKTYVAEFHFLRRNLACALKSLKEYKTLVRPKLEYATHIWGPNSKLQINQVEGVRRSAAR